MSDDVEAVFGRKVRALRKEAGWSQEFLVARLLAKSGLRWHQTTLAKTEAGTRPLRLSEAVAIAGVFGQPLMALLSDVPPEAPDARIARMERALWQVGIVSNEALS